MLQATLGRIGRGQKFQGGDTPRRVRTPTHPEAFRRGDGLAHVQIGVLSRADYDIDARVRVLLARTGGGGADAGDRQRQGGLVDVSAGGRFGGQRLRVEDVVPTTWAVLALLLLGGWVLMLWFV